ncbi:hypothetical protein RFI_04665 [Reticulomyxa filosa]|uniref:Uncharacterized protein n=1 Tax=Reticulomyxa filosa TaxID=46433 RepID=X6P2U1_RETFI|nr:hypothetical protein RFI_04665 [Reticulomyxa filosa]|eukprot:ETO32453.1 hypothetical protein RFI_04665 [Reticulomyxa filosa]
MTIEEKDKTKTSSTTPIMELFRTVKNPEEKQPEVKPETKSDDNTKPPEESQQKEPEKEQAPAPTKNAPPPKNNANIFDDVIAETMPFHSGFLLFLNYSLIIAKEHPIVATKPFLAHCLTLVLQKSENSKFDNDNVITKFWFVTGQFLFSQAASTLFILGCFLLYVEYNKEADFVCKAK